MVHFVASSRDNIQKAFQDYQYGRNGFENIKTWQTLISGGVTKEMIEGPLNGNLEKELLRKGILGKAHKESCPCCCST